LGHVCNDVQAAPFASFICSAVMHSENFFAILLIGNEINPTGEQHRHHFYIFLLFANLT